MVEFPAIGNSEDVAAALEAQGQALEAQGHALRNQAIGLQARADRLRELAEQVRDQGLRSGGRVVAPPPEAELESRLRDILTSCELASEAFLAAEMGVTIRTLKPKLAELVDDGKVASLRRRGERVYTWVFPDGRGDAPNDAPTQEGRVQAEIRRDAQMIDVDRGNPVRLVTSNRDRRARSTPGVRHKMKLKDAAYERQEAAKAARAADQQAKAAQTPRPKGKKK